MEQKRKVLSNDEICQIAIDMEEASARFYADMKSRFDLPELKQVFDELIVMEKKHVEQYRKMFKRRLGADQFFLSPESSDYLTTILAESPVATAQAIAERYGSINTIVDALDLGILMEKEAVLFYLGLDGGMDRILSREEHQIVKDILAEEREHIKILAGLKVKYRS